MEGLISLRNRLTQKHIGKLKSQNPNEIDWIVPPPPVPGLSDLILPLDSAEKIREHGEAHSNCVSTYIEDVAEGHYKHSLPGGYENYVDLHSLADFTSAYLTSRIDSVDWLAFFHPLNLQQITFPSSYWGRSGFRENPEPHDIGR